MPKADFTASTHASQLKANVCSCKMKTHHNLLPRPAIPGGYRGTYREGLFLARGNIEQYCIRVSSSCRSPASYSCELSCCHGAFESRGQSECLYTTGRNRNTWWNAVDSGGTRLSASGMCACGLGGLQALDRKRPCEHFGRQTTAKMIQQCTYENGPKSSFPMDTASMCDTSHTQSPDTELKQVNVGRLSTFAS